MSLSVAAQVATVEYVQGWVDIKRPSGVTVEALIGDTINKDDTIITGDDGTATLAQAGASEIVISPNSVFSIREIDSGGEKETVMHAALGSIKFRFLRLFGKEPKISTPSTVAGVRGTEFTVYAGDEGSALFTVDSGEVIVTSQGIPVLLVDNEGVEVKAGRAPGAKFALKGRAVDYSSWNSEKQAEFSADPIAGLRGIERQMKEYLREVDNLKVNWEQAREDIRKLREERAQILKEQGNEAAQRFYEEMIVPVGAEQAMYLLNLRYYMLSGFSLKRYVLAKQYSIEKGHALAERNSVMNEEFLDIFQRIQVEFEQYAAAFIVAADI